MVHIEAGSRYEQPNIFTGLMAAYGLNCKFFLKNTGQHTIIFAFRFWKFLDQSFIGIFFCKQPNKILIDFCRIIFESKYGWDSDIPLFEKHFCSFGIEYDLDEMFEWVDWVESIELLKILYVGGDLCLEIAFWFVILHVYNNICEIIEVEKVE